MKLFRKAKDGGPESHTTGYWLIEWKRGFSIALIRFEDGSRDAYHSHAFNAVSWLLMGQLVEYIYEKGNNPGVIHYLPSWLPIVTPRTRMHMVMSKGRSWALTFRGPWAKTWNEYIPATGAAYALSDGRVKVG